MQRQPQLGRSLVPVGLIALIEVFVLLLTACGGSGSGAKAPSSTPAPSHPTLAQLVGKPTIKTLAATFEVIGQVRNLDTARHDMFLKATLKDASGQVVGTAEGRAEDLAAGETETYTLQGPLSAVTRSGLLSLLKPPTATPSGAWPTPMLSICTSSKTKWCLKV